MRYTILEVITMRRKFWLLAAVCLLVCLLAGCGSKEQTVTPDFVLTYADNQPADYPTTQGAERFAALVKERTGGKVVIQVKSGGEYGTEQEVWQQLSIGGIDFARLSLLPGKSCQFYRFRPTCIGIMKCTITVKHRTSHP